MVPVRVMITLLRAFVINVLTFERYGLNRRCTLRCALQQTAAILEPAGYFR
jgi:hypothetical protein